MPPTYAVVEFHGATPAHAPLPPGVEVGVGVAVVPEGGVGVGVGGGGGGVAPANCTMILVKSQSFWGTLLHVPERLPLLSGGLHWRSRLTDQKV